VGCCGKKRDAVADAGGSLPLRGEKRKVMQPESHDAGPLKDKWISLQNKKYNFNKKILKKKRPEQ
jgi:hypothetical protein